MNKLERVLLGKQPFRACSWCDLLVAAILLEPKVATQVREVYVLVELHGVNTTGEMVVDHLQKLGL
jgi:inosine-uridine nucleoside N-ribohydrolase